MKKIESLFLVAEDAIKNSYSPYSKFGVGASLLTKDGRIFSGTNVENISYGLSICAERVAVFSGISSGCRYFTDMDIVTTSGKPVFPCGACRQVLMELGDSQFANSFQREPNKNCKTIKIIPRCFYLTPVKP